MNYLYINKNEVLRYLGYKNQFLDDKINILIEECIDEIKKLVKIRYVYKYFGVNREEDSIILEKCYFNLEGRDIYKHLENADECILIAGTLGSLVDMRIRYYEKKYLTKALILDACANVAIEEVLDKACEEIEGDLKNIKKKLTHRYSPGYGDLDLNIQKRVISILEADKKIGLTASLNNILLPRKSVTAVIGVVDNELKLESKTCSSCTKFHNCEFRNEGECCGD